MSELPLLSLFFLVALLYSSVGHAGASGYLAVMALVIELNEATARPTALALNCLVAAIGTIQFARAGQIDLRKLWPFLLGSVPFVIVGTSWKLTDQFYSTCVGIVLVAAALRLLLKLPDAIAPKLIPMLPAILCGAGIGLLSGLTGTGGGIFLTPLLLFLGWATTRQAAGLSIAFILINSAVGFANRLFADNVAMPPEAYGWAAAAAVGGFLGSRFGAKYGSGLILRRLLALVLVIASVKLFAN